MESHSRLYRGVAGWFASIGEEKSLVIPSEARDLGSFWHPAEPQIPRRSAPRNDKRMGVFRIGAFANSPRHFSSPLELRSSNLPPPSRVVIAPMLLFGFRNYGRNLQPVPGAINRHKRHVRRPHVLRRIGNVVFDEHFHSNFHRATKHAIHRRTP